MLTTISLFLTVLILYVWKKCTDENYWSKRGVPFEKSLTFFGNALQTFLIRKNVGDMTRDLYFKRRDSFFGIWVLRKPQLFVKCPNLIKQILVKDFNYFCDRYVTCDEDADKFSANMLFFMKNPKWRIFRAQTTPLFSISRMKNIFPEMQSISKSMVEFINTKADEDSVNASDVFVKFTTQVAYATAFGLDSKSFQNEDTPFVSLVKNIFTLKISNLVSRASQYSKSSLVKVLKLKIVESSVVNFLKEIFCEIEESRKSQHVQRKDVMDFLIKLKNENNMGETEIVAQMAQFLVAGYDTTNTTIALALYELALNKQIQDKLRHEIYDYLDSNGEVTYSSLNIMEYLDKVIHETLRKYPIVPVLGRTCLKDYKIPNTATVIEKGIEVIISLTGLHHDPKYYPQPDVFDPERFSDENIQKRHPYSYLPFGRGPRCCIGERLGVMLVKLGIVHVIKSFQINICNETDIPLQFDPRKITLSVVGGVFVQFVKLD